MKLPLRFFGIGLLTASLVFALSLYFFKDKNSSLESESIENIAEFLEDKGYHVISQEDYIAYSVYEQKQQEQANDEEKNDNDNNEDDIKENDENNTNDNEENNNESPKVLILLGVPGSYLIATEDSYLGDLVRRAGGENVFREQDGLEYIAANTEHLQQAEPDIILRAAHGMPDAVVEMFDKERSEERRV